MEGLIEDIAPRGGIRVKYKDVFDLKMFYEDLHDYLVEEEWIDHEDKLDHWETYYGERIDHGGVKELWFQWRLFKKPKDAAFLSYYMDLDFHGLGISDTEIMREGMKLKVSKGELEVTIKPYLVKEYEKEFKKILFLKELKELFSRRIYREQLEQRKKELYQETYVLQNWIKQWFQMKRHLPYQESKSFYPSQAWPSHIKQ